MFITLLLVSSIVGSASPLDSTAIASPAAQRVAVARKQVEASPKAFQFYNELAFALCREARDKSDIALYDEANLALDQALSLSSGNYEALKLRAAVLLGKREFQEALKLSQNLNKKVPDDIGGWALLTDANSALGNYAEAERDAQWILDLRPGSSLGFEKAAALRELFGDNEGAVEFYEEALRRTSQSDADQRAWLLTQKARVMLAAGNPKAAGEILVEVFRLFPNSQQASLVLADVKAASGDYKDAAAIFEKCYQAVPTCGVLYRWANALRQAGQNEKAALQFAAFETKARAEIAKTYNANLELIAYYCDHKSDPAEALRIATLESSRRKDAATLAAFAWALYQNGKFNEAKAQMDRALAVGVRDPNYLCHAALISAKVNPSVQGAPGSCVSQTSWSAQNVAAPLGVSK